MVSADKYSRILSLLISVDETIAVPGTLYALNSPIPRQWTVPNIIFL
jgi:hypothetical protein